MLSFDITDRSIKIVEGIQNKGKVKVNTVSTINLDEGIIINGIVEKASDLAMIINKELEIKKMQRKEAVVCVSSNFATFKEMDVPNAKAWQFKTMVETKLQQAVNVYEEQSVGYTVMSGESDNKKGPDGTVKVLVTSCPKTLVESYKKVFSMLRISLKDMSISCNCISNIITKDKNYIKMMPLLLVEADPTYININIFENGNLSFSRFATISPDNYDDKDDYMFQAINENIFRLLQFQDMRRKQSISNVVFYGDTTLFDRFSEYLSPMGIKSSLLRINNSSIHVNYANALGAMMSGENTVDSTNLLDSEIDATKQVQVSAKLVGLQIGASFLAGLAIVVIILTSMNIYDSSINKKINKIDNYVNSTEVVNSLNEVNELKSNINVLKDYRIKLGTVTDFVNSKPVLRSEVFEQINNSFDGSNYDFESLIFDNGMISESYVVSDNTIPSNMVTKLLADKNNVDTVFYNGYTLTDNTDYKVDLSLILKGDITLGKESKLLDVYSAQESTDENNVTKDGDKE